MIERLVLTLKQGIAWLTLVPLRRKAFQRELTELASWYNSHRTPMTRAGRTPEEIYHRLRPMNRRPRFEPRAAWPRRSGCAKPVTLVKGRPGVRSACEITFLGKRYPIMDRDTKFSDVFRKILADEGVESVRLPPRSPNLNPHLERFMRSVKEEALEGMIFFGETMLRRGARKYLLPYREERNHQGLANKILHPR